MGLNEQVAGIISELHAGSLVPGANLTVTVEVTPAAAPTYNPATGAMTTPASAAVAVGALIRDVTLREVAASGGLLLAGDAVFTVPAASFPAGSPLPGSTIVFDGARWRVVAFQTVRLGPTSLQFRLTGRRDGEAA